VSNHIQGERRPISSRQTYLALQISKWLAAKGIRPNQVSVMSMVFSLLAAVCMICSPCFVGLSHGCWLVGAIGFILLRLLANLFDGMIAIEGKAAGKSGEIYNDLPDRPSDVMILLGAGYAASVIPGAITLGWLTALLAVMTAYVRLLGKSAGTKQYFMGPMAKQHRMAVMMIACLLGAIIGNPYDTSLIFICALVLIMLGTMLTIARRLKNIVSDLEKK
jgi:phosphatidylglycerophosphate synthase